MDQAGIRITPVTSGIGARVDGADLTAPVPQPQADTLRRALLDHLVLFFPAASTTRSQGTARASTADDAGDAADAAQHRLAAVFGELRGHPVQEFLGTRQMVGVVGTDDYQPGQDSHFHTDYSFHTDIPDVAVLRSVIAPDHGGDTLWSNMYAAHDALSPALRGFLETLDARHDQGPDFNAHIRRHFDRDHADAVFDAFPGAVHPMVTVHPQTGRRLLFVNPGYTRSVVGLRTAESNALLALLFRHLESAQFTCRYRWQAGDIAVWDERATLHKGEASYHPAKRELRRLNTGHFVPRRAAA